MKIIAMFCSFSRNNLKFSDPALNFLKICISYEHNCSPHAALNYSGKQSKVCICVTNAADARTLGISCVKALFKFTWLDIKSINVRIRIILWSCWEHQWVTASAEERGEKRSLGNERSGIALSCMKPLKASACSLGFCSEIEIFRFISINHRNYSRQFVLEGITEIAQ